MHSDYFKMIFSCGMCLIMLSIRKHLILKPVKDGEITNYSLECEFLNELPIRVAK